MAEKNLEWVSWREETEDKSLTLHISELENGLLLIISDKGPRIGTIAVGTPGISMKKQASTSSVPIVFGIRNELFSRAIAERVAHISKKIVIASVFLSDTTPELAQRALKFAVDSIQEYLSKKEKAENSK